MNYRDALYYILTGKTFDGKKAAKLGLVNESVPLSDLRSAVLSLAEDVKKINPETLKHAKEAFKMSRDMDFDQAYDYLAAKNDQLGTSPVHIQNDGRQIPSFHLPPSSPWPLDRQEGLW